MKKGILLLSIVIVNLLSSCSSDNDNQSIATNTTGQISATIDNQNWSTQYAIASVSSVDFNGNSNMTLQIIGTKLDQSSLSFILPINNLSVGTYNFYGENADALLTYNNPNGDFYASAEIGGQFSITISAINTATGTLSGSFSGTLVDYNGNTISVTNGSINTISIYNSSIYSNGSMSLSKNSGTPFTMDSDSSDGKYLVLNEFNDKLVLAGYNLVAGQNSEVFSILLPKNVAPGTYNIFTNASFDATFSNDSNGPDYNLTSGTITISANSNNNVVGTFSYNANNGVNTIAVTNGSFSVTYN